MGNWRRWKKICNFPGRFQRSTMLWRRVSELFLPHSGKLQRATPRLWWGYVRHKRFSLSFSCIYDRGGKKKRGRSWRRRWFSPLDWFLAQFLQIAFDIAIESDVWEWKQQAQLLPVFSIPERCCCTLSARERELLNGYRIDHGGNYLFRSNLHAVMCRNGSSDTPIRSRDRGKNISQEFANQIHVRTDSW